MFFLFCQESRRITWSSKAPKPGNSSALSHNNIWLLRMFCKLGHQGCRSAQRRVFRRKLKNQGCSFTGVNRCGSFPLLFAAHSLFIIWTNLKRSKKDSRGHQRGCEESEFGSLGPPDFTEIHHRGYIQVPSGFLTRSEIRKSQSSFAPSTNK